MAQEKTVTEILVGKTPGLDGLLKFIEPFGQ